jgi:hypothetical protein
MNIQRAHVLLPQDLVEEIDALVGPRGRSAFLAETARAELRRRNLLGILESHEPVWEDKNHPELTDGTSAWVRQQRAENDQRGSHAETGEQE